MQTNNYEKYKCELCGETFRLKMTLNTHKCKNKERKYKTKTFINL